MSKELEELRECLEKSEEMESGREKREEEYREIIRLSSSAIQRNKDAILQLIRSKATGEGVKEGQREERANLCRMSADLDIVILKMTEYGFSTQDFNRKQQEE